MEHLWIGESANFVNVGNHISYICSLFRSHGSGDFVSGSDVNSGQNVLVLIHIYNISLGMHNKSD